MHGESGAPWLSVWALPLDAWGQILALLLSNCVILGCLLAGQAALL